MSNLIPCLGGMCNSREKCANYLDPFTRANPLERLCGTNEEPELMRSYTFGLRPVETPCAEEIGLSFGTLG
jgi:hypothetical protein